MFSTEDRQGRADDTVSALLSGVRYAFQPLINIQTGAIMAVEALARPTGAVIHDLFQTAARQRRLTDFDIQLATGALRSAAAHDTLLPLHINILGGTIAYDLASLEQLGEVLRETGRREHEITLEIGPPLARLHPPQLIEGVNRLRELGYRIALDGVGDGDVSLALIADLNPDIVKIDRGVIDGLPNEPGRVAVVEAARHLCSSIDAQLVAEGVETETQLAALRHQGIRLVQGNMLASAARRPPTARTVPGLVAEVANPDTPRTTTPAGPLVNEFLSPATMLPAGATADEVRTVFVDSPEINGVVLVDEANRPQSSIDRNRFLLAFTGPFGHALYATRPAARLAEEPKAVTTSTTAMEYLDMVASAEASNAQDDTIVVDESGRCLGVIRAAQLIRGMADLKVEEAVSLNPLTRLPGTDTIAKDVARRIAAGDVFAVSWLDIDEFKSINDSVGFSAGDNLIRGIGRSLSDVATALSSARVGHVGGDDFLLVADLDDLVPMCEMVLDPARETAGLPVTVSLATVICAPSTIKDYDHVSKLLAPLKRRAKHLQGTSWILAEPRADRVDVLRGFETTASDSALAVPDARQHRDAE